MLVGNQVGDTVGLGVTAVGVPEVSFAASRRVERATGMAMAATTAHANKMSKTQRYGRRYHFIASSARGSLVSIPSSNCLPSSLSMVGVSYINGRFLSVELCDCYKCPKMCLACVVLSGVSRAMVGTRP